MSFASGFFYYALLKVLLDTTACAFGLQVTSASVWLSESTTGGWSELVPFTATATTASYDWNATYVAADPVEILLKKLGQVVFPGVVSVMFVDHKWLCRHRLLSS